MTARALPDCAHCDADQTLSVTFAEQGIRYCECSCCGKITGVDAHGRAHRITTGLRDERDVLGNVITDP